MPGGVDDVIAGRVDQARRRRARVSTEQRIAYVRGLVEPFGGSAQPRTRPVSGSGRSEADGDGFRVDEVEIEVLTGAWFRVQILIPHGLPGPVPTVVAVHGHGPGTTAITGLQEATVNARPGKPGGSGRPGSPRERRSAPTARPLYARELARRGLVVAVPEVVGFGRRMTPRDTTYDPGAESSCHRLASTLLMLGRSLAGLRVAELLGALAYVHTLPQVDPDRIGVIGHSGGAMLAMLTLAIEPRLAAGVLIGYPNTFADSVLAVHHCLCNALPDVLRVAEMPDLLELAAPRPLFLESGGQDPIFPAAGFRVAVEQVSRRYAEVGAAASFDHDLVPGLGHEVSGRRSVDWLAARLRDG